MRRREFLQLGAIAVPLASSPQLAHGLEPSLLTIPQETSDEITAGATVDRTATVAVVLSSLKGHQDHFGVDVKGLADPRPVGSELTDEQVDAWVRRAIELGTTLQGGLPTIIAPDEWVVIKPDVSVCYTAAGETVQGTVTDIRIVRSLIAFLISNNCGSRFTIAETLPECQRGGQSNTEVTAWTTDWGGAFGGLSYQRIIDELSQAYPSLEFELIDLRSDRTIRSPVPGTVSETSEPGRYYELPRTIQQCDRLISVAPLKTHAQLGVSLTLGTYLGIVPEVADQRQDSPAEDPGKLAELAVDMFSYHPADYALVGGGWSRVDGRDKHCNILIASANGLAADMVGNAVLGIDARKTAVLQLAERRALSAQDLEMIWVRGNDIDEAREALQNAPQR